MDRGAWWAAVHEVTKSRTQLKWSKQYKFIYLFNLFLVALGLCHGEGFFLIAANRVRGLLIAVASLVVKKERKVKLLSRVQLFATPWTVALPGSSVRGIFQARILEWVAISFSRRSSWPRNWTQVSCLVGRRFTIWAMPQSVLVVEHRSIVVAQGLSCSVTCGIFPDQRSHPCLLH